MRAILGHMSAAAPAAAGDTWLSVAQAGARCGGVDEKTVRRWIKAGRLPGYFIGGRWRIKATDAEAFVESGRYNPGG